MKKLMAVPLLFLVTFSTSQNTSIPISKEVPKTKVDLESDVETIILKNQENVRLIKLGVESNKEKIKKLKESDEKLEKELIQKELTPVPTPSKTLSSKVTPQQVVKTEVRTVLVQPIINIVFEPVKDSVKTTRLDSICVDKRKPLFGKKKCISWRILSINN